MLIRYFWGLLSAVDIYLKKKKRRRSITTLLSCCVVCSQRQEKKNMKKQQKAPSHLSPLLTFLPHRDHHLIGRTVYRYIFLFWVLLYLCRQSLNYTLTRQKDKKKKKKGKQITAAWVSSLIHIMSWWCQPRCELDFALPVVSDGDRGGNYSTFKEPLRPATGKGWSL